MQKKIDDSRYYDSEALYIKGDLNKETKERMKLAEEKYQKEQAKFDLWYEAEGRREEIRELEEKLRKLRGE